MLDGREKEPYTKKQNKHSQDNGVLQRRSGTLLEQECELEQKELDFSKSSSFCLSLLNCIGAVKCRRRKEAFRGENALEKGRTVMVRKIIADNGKNKKREKIYDIWKVH